MSSRTGWQFSAVVRKTLKHVCLFKCRSWNLQADPNGARHHRNRAEQPEMKLENGPLSVHSKVQLIHQLIVENLS
jgi:hypothetical protein